MLKKIRDTVLHYKMIQKGDFVLAAVSGGADSVALLLELLDLRDEWGIEISAAHINHGLRGEAADADEAFVKTLCAEKGVPLWVYAADVRGKARTEGLTLEEAGRAERYRCLEQALREQLPKHRRGKIAVAHTRDDTAETVLLNLFRGTGLKGLGGIPPVRGHIIRPLIEISRSEIEIFLTERGQPYRTDESNADPAYARNRIRNIILPAINEQFGPGAQAAENIARSAALLRADEEFLAQTAREAYEKCLIPSDRIPNNPPHPTARTRTAPKSTGSKPIPSNNTQNNATPQHAAAILLDIHQLSALPAALAPRVIREAVAYIGGLRDISAAHIGAALDIARGQTGRTAALPRGVRIRREYDKLTVYREEKHKIKSKFDNKRYADIPPEKDIIRFDIPVRLDIPVSFPFSQKYIVASLTPPVSSINGCTKIFRYDKINTFLTVRTRRPGDRIYLDGAGHRKLQDYFTDRKIPREERDCILMLADGSDILWIMDEKNRVNGKYKPESGADNIYITIYNPVTNGVRN